MKAENVIKYWSFYHVPKMKYVRAILLGFALIFGIFIAKLIVLLV